MEILSEPCSNLTYSSSNNEIIEDFPIENHESPVKIRSSASFEGNGREVNHNNDGLQIMQKITMNPVVSQQTRHARRIYVGGIPIGMYMKIYL
jgi:hypothetical protein